MKFRHKLTMVGITFLVIVAVGIFVLERKEAVEKQKKLEASPLMNPEFYKNPDFSLIDDSMYLDVIEEGIKQKRKQIEDIVNNKEEPSFMNTVFALDQSGKLLQDTAELFFHLTYAAFTPGMEEVEETISTKMSELEDEIMYNEGLFSKIKVVYDKKDSLNLSGKELRLLETLYEAFIKNGSLLSVEDKKKVKDINKELVRLTTKFSQNLLKESASVYILLEESEKDRLKGVAEDDIASFKKEAQAKGKSGYLLSYINPRVREILRVGEDRELRKTLWEFYQKQGRDLNSDLVLSIMKLRAKKANILGFSSHSEYVLKGNSMAGSPKEARDLLESILPYSMSSMKKDRVELEKLARKLESDPGFDLQIWDWAYYTEKLREERFNYKDSDLKVYFKLSSVRDGVFEAIKRLYGLEFIKRDDISLYYDDSNHGIDTYEVRSDGESVGVLYLDYYARANKKAGAWSTSIRSKQAEFDESGKFLRYQNPIEVVVFNFPAPSNEGVLLSLRDVETFFHEMGHAVNAFFIDPVYASLTESYRDFVELPSQLFEHWATSSEYLPEYAKHYKTHKSIDSSLVKKIQDSMIFDRGYFVSRQLFLGLEDLGWHSLSEHEINKYESEASFEEDYLKKLGLTSEYDFVPRAHRFSHIISTGYDSRYYGYMWSDMLVEDAYELFRTQGIFNQKVSSSFRDNILTVANSQDPMSAYEKFRGRRPTVDALLRKEGFKK